METFNIGNKIYYQVENETQLCSIGQGGSMSIHGIVHIYGQNFPYIVTNFF